MHESYGKSHDADIITNNSQSSYHIPTAEASESAVMPRSATDATRFTSTTPHASAKVPSSTTKPKAPPQRKPGPAGETPQEKVRRLRAAADAARDAQVSTFDKIIVRGRVWADRAHRFTALSLIGATCKLPFKLSLQTAQSMR